MEKENLIKNAKKLYLEDGYSCSESILHALREAGVPVPDSLLRSVTGLRAGIGGAGCVCGTLMAVVLMLGYLYGRTNNHEDEKKANQLSAQLHDKFKEKFKSTCCRVLTRKYDFKSKERKEFCAGLVEFVISELIDILPKEIEESF